MRALPTSVAGAQDSNGEVILAPKSAEAAAAFAKAVARGHAIAGALGELAAARLVAPTSTSSLKSALARAGREG